MIMERNYQPVIIFSFSKKDCEGMALQMSKLDLNTEDEKKLVESGSPYSSPIRICKQLRCLAPVL